MSEDLAQFKTSLADELKRRSQIEVQLRAASSTNAQLMLECDQFKESVTNWANAMTLRDQRIQEANNRIELLSADLNTSIRKFNTLVTNYNAVVKDFNALQSNSATNVAGK